MNNPAATGEHPAKIPQGVSRHEEVVKKSTFIALIGPAQSPREALDFIARQRVDEATHNCWAYKVGQEYRFSDDGEPGGTAGKPILAAIEGQGFDQTVALVIRHFGGIKLGTGGLIRAYGGVVARGLQQAPFEWLVPQATLRLRVPFEHAQILHNLIKQHRATLLEEIYQADGVYLQLQLPAASEAAFKHEATNLTRGQAEIFTLNQSGDTSVTG